MVEEISATECRFTSKGRAMRDRIVDAAAKLIFAAGARDTTLDQVRLAVGASKSQLYHYFADKDELLHAVIDLQGERIILVQEPELGAIQSIASLKRWRDKVVELGDVHGTIGGCAIGSLASELVGHSEAFRCALEVHFNHWAARIEEGLARMRSNGCLDARFDPRTLSAAFLAAIQGGLLLAKLQRTSSALAAALDEIICSIECRSLPS